MTTEFAEALSEARADERKRCAQRLREMARELKARSETWSNDINKALDLKGAACLRDAADELERL